MTTQDVTPLWDAKKVGGAFARIAKPDGTVGADEIMLVIMGMIGEYELERAERATLTARVALSEQRHAECTTSLITEVRRVERLKARIAALEADERRMLNLFTELTPGGSEFANDPKRCVDYAKERMSKQWGQIRSRQLRIKELEAEVERQRARAEAAIEWANEQQPQAQAGRWLPVEDGSYVAGNPKDNVAVETVDGEVWLTVTEKLFEGDDETAEGLIKLPDNIRLCRWQEGSES